MGVFQRTGREFMGEGVQVGEKELKGKEGQGGLPKQAKRVL